MCLKCRTFVVGTELKAFTMLLKKNHAKKKGSSRIATPNVKQSKQTNYEMQKAIICTPLWIRTTHQLHISNGVLKWEGKPNATAELNRRSVCGVPLPTPAIVWKIGRAGSFMSHTFSPLSLEVSYCRGE